MAQGEQLMPPVTAAPKNQELEGEALNEAYALETARVLRQRLDLVAVLFALLGGLFGVLEVGHHPETLSTVVILVGVELTACGLALLACRVARWRHAAGTIAAILASFLVVFITVTGTATGDSAERAAIYQVCLLTGFAVLLPWGWRRQLWVVAASFAGIGVALPFLPGGEAAAYACAAVLNGAVTSLCSAYFLDRYRHDAFVRTALLTGVSAAKQEEAEINASLLHIAEALSTHLGRPDILQQVIALSADALGSTARAAFCGTTQARASACMPPRAVCRGS